MTWFLYATLLLSLLSRGRGFDSLGRENVFMSNKELRSQTGKRSSPMEQTLPAQYSTREDKGKINAFMGESNMTFHVNYSL